MLNSKAPKFTLLASNGQEIMLSELLNSFVVLIFYPKNDSPTCNRQLTDFNVNMADFFDLDARVFGINTATVAKQREYCSRKKLEFPILSDPGGKVAKLYKAHLRWLPFNRRTVVVVDPEGVICFYQRGLPSHNEIAEAIKARRQSLAKAPARQ